MLVDILREYAANEIQCIKDHEHPTKVCVSEHAILLQWKIYLPQWDLFQRILTQYLLEMHHVNVDFDIVRMELQVTDAMYHALCHGRCFNDGFSYSLDASEEDDYVYVLTIEKRYIPGDEK